MHLSTNSDYDPGMPLIGPGTRAGDYPRSTSHDSDWLIVGQLEWTTLAGVPANTFAKWLARGELPAADGPVVNGVVTWRLSTLIAWAKGTDRLPEHMEGMYERLVALLEAKPDLPKPVNEMTVVELAELTARRITDPAELELPLTAL